MKSYIVTVRTETLDYYRVIANSAENAMAVWPDGQFLHTDAAYLRAEPLKAVEAGE